MVCSPVAEDLLADQAVYSKFRRNLQNMHSKHDYFLFLAVQNTPTDCVIPLRGGETLS